MHDNVTSPKTTDNALRAKATQTSLSRSLSLSVQTSLSVCENTFPRGIGKTLFRPGPVGGGASDDGTSKGPDLMPVWLLLLEWIPSLC